MKPQDSPSTCWHGPCRPFPQSPRGRHSLASKFAFPSVISPAAFPAGRKSDMTAPAAATPCALGHPGPAPGGSEHPPGGFTETRGPPPSPGHPPHSLLCPRPPSRGARGQNHRGSSSADRRALGALSTRLFRRGLRRTKTKETAASQRSVRRKDQPLHFCGPPSLL